MRTPADSPQVQLTLDQCNRLPRYAVAELERLSRALKTAQAAIDAERRDAPGNIVLNPYATYPTIIGNDRATIEYRVSDDVALLVDLRDGEAVITASGAGAMDLQIRPQACNAARVRAARHR